MRADETGRDPAPIEPVECRCPCHAPKVIGYGPGSAQALAPEIGRAAGTIPVKAVTAGEYAAACEAFVISVVEDRVRHLGRAWHRFSHSRPTCADQEMARSGKHCTARDACGKRRRAGGRIMTRWITLSAANEELHRFTIRASNNPNLDVFLDRLRAVVRQTQHFAA